MFSKFDKLNLFLTKVIVSRVKDKSSQRLMRWRQTLIDLKERSEVAKNQEAKEAQLLTLKSMANIGAKISKILLFPSTKTIQHIQKAITQEGSFKPINVN